MCYLGGLLAMKGDFDEARDFVTRGRALFAELGNRYGLATHSVIAGQIELLAGDANAAVDVLDSGYRSFEEMGETGVLSTVAAFLAEALLELDRAEDAARFAAISEETASDDDAASQILSRVVRARILAREGDRAGAEELLREATERADETDFLDLQGKVWAAVAEIADGPVADEAAEGARRVRGEGQCRLGGCPAPLERERSRPQRRQPPGGNRLRGGRALGLTGHGRGDELTQVSRA